MEAVRPPLGHIEERQGGATHPPAMHCDCLEAKALLLQTEKFSCDGLVLCTVLLDIVIMRVERRESVKSGADAQIFETARAWARR